MKLYEIISVLEKAFPPEHAYEWDNVGLLLGDRNAEIKKILLTLDITESVVEEAIQKNCELILSHHPMLFSGIKHITTDSAEGRVILSAAKNRLNIFAAHTNCDVADGGINAHLAELLGIEDAEPLEDCGLGRIGRIKECSLSDFAESVKLALNLDFVRVCGDKNRIIKTVAVGSGSCSESIPFAIEKGADVMITGDTKYHTMLDSVGDICIIDAGHHGTEYIVCDIFEKLLADYPIETVKSESKDVYMYI